MKGPLLINFLLAFFWMAVTGEFTGRNLIVGFLIGSGVLLFTQPLLSSARYWKQLWDMLQLIARFLVNLVLSSLRVAVDTMKPRLRMTSGVIALPLDVETDAEITLLANLISLTPGTLSLEVSEDRRTLYIHAMYLDAEDIDRTRTEIKQTLERRVIQAMRGQVLE